MTNIDHDALARRIEEAIRHNNAAPFIGIVQVTTQQCIANILREALPTSEDVEDALRDIACYVGAGGYNSAEVNVVQMAAKIKASFDDVHRKLMESQS